MVGQFGLIGGVEKWLFGSSGLLMGFRSSLMEVEDGGGVSMVKSMSMAKG